MSIYKVGKCDYCGDKNVVVRGTPFMADIPSWMCKICWDFTKSEYADSNGEYIPKFSSEELEYQELLAML